MDESKVARFYWPSVCIMQTRRRGHGDANMRGVVRESRATPAHAISQRYYMISITDRRLTSSNWLAL